MADPAQPNDIRRALEEWVAQPGGNTNRHLAERYFDENRQLEEMVRFYRKLIGEE